jgi:serine phosphatase RsbU (regulator of sigma subunit)
VTITDRPALDLREVLRITCAASPVEAIDVMADGLAILIGATEVHFLITNVTHRAVVPFAGSRANAARVLQENGRVPVIPLRGTEYDRVLRGQRIVRLREDGGERLLVPVTESGDALGVIDVHLPRRADERVFADVTAVAEALARIVIASRRHSDLMDWAQDTSPFSLAAEIQRRLLPGSYTCETDRFTLAGWLEPANAVGGDTFDYSLDRDNLHLSVTDAVGNDVNAALLASVLLGSLRNSRRRGADLAEQARRANDALAGHAHVGQFVTGMLARVDLRTGVLRFVNAGHPLPYLVRDGRVSEIELAVDMPFGLYAGREFRVQEVLLRPGDRVVLLTDGMLERNAEDLDLPAMLERDAGTHPRELVYELAETVLHATGGDLDDDATVLCLDWRGAPDDRPDRPDLDLDLDHPENDRPQHDREE